MKQKRHLTTLRRRYIVMLRLLTVIIATAVALFIAQVGTSWPTWSRYLAAGVSLSFLAFEPLIRNLLWKCFDRRLNLDGLWEGTTTYKARVLAPNSGIDAMFPNRSISHYVWIEQYALSIRVIPTTSSDFVLWHSEAAELYDDGSLVMAYTVNYSSAEVLGEPFPNQAIGIEKMKPVAFGRFGSPITMAGEFWHCAQGMYPVYRGTVTYKRITGKKARYAALGPTRPMTPPIPSTTYGHNAADRQFTESKVRPVSPAKALSNDGPTVLPQPSRGGVNRRKKGRQ